MKMDIDKDTKLTAAQSMADLIIWAATADFITPGEFNATIRTLMPVMDKEFAGWISMGIMLRMYELAKDTGADTHQLADKIADIIAKEADDNDEQRS